MAKNEPPKTRNWKAQELINPGGGGYHLIVTGEVELGNTNETPHLKEHHPPGKNPNILLLDLTVTSHGQGNDVVNWKPVRFEKTPTSGRLSEIGILWEGKEIAKSKVEHPK
jgi:hypothetical protein